MDGVLGIHSHSGRLLNVVRVALLFTDNRRDGSSSACTRSIQPSARSVGRATNAGRDGRG